MPLSSLLVHKVLLVSGWLNNDIFVLTVPKSILSDWQDLTVNDTSSHGDGWVYQFFFIFPAMLI